MPELVISCLLALGLLAQLPEKAPEVRVEAFLFERSTAEGVVPEAVVLLRSAGEDPSVPGFLLEQDVTFRDGGVTILHDEEVRETGWHMVRRELRSPGSTGRSFSAQPDGKGGLRVLRWGFNVPVHEHWSRPAPRLPLEVIHGWRNGTQEPGPLLIFDPLTEGPCLVRASLETGDPRGEVEGEDTRTLTLRREDESLMGRYVFSGARLVALQWRDGGGWARRIEEREALRLVSRWRVERDPEAEAWAAIQAAKQSRRRAR